MLNDMRNKEQHYIIHYLPLTGCSFTLCRICFLFENKTILFYFFYFRYINIFLQNFRRFSFILPNIMRMIWPHIFHIFFQVASELQNIGYKTAFCGHSLFFFWQFLTIKTLIKLQKHYISNVPTVNMVMPILIILPYIKKSSEPWNLFTYSATIETPT